MEKKLQITKNQRIAPFKQRRARQFRKSMTPAETLLWGALRAKGAAGVRFRRQQIIDGFIADFYCASARLVVELDGSFHASKDQRFLDGERDKILARKGILTLRFLNREVFEDSKGVQARIEKVVLERLGGVERQ